ncbi:MAG: hypothetical protein PHU86_03490 [Patescibacteria group bacterium]|nr:hypothetical protein [Patescibacteria group bacterium]
MEVLEVLIWAFAISVCATITIFIITITSSNTFVRTLPSIPFGITFALLSIMLIQVDMNLTWLRILVIAISIFASVFWFGFFILACLLDRWIKKNPPQVWKAEELVSLNRKVV